MKKRDRSDSTFGFCIAVVVLIFVLMTALGIETKRADRAELDLEAYMFDLMDNVDFDRIKQVLKRDTDLSDKEIDATIQRLFTRQNLVLEAKKFTTIYFEGEK
jgi:hypothetical protein